MEGTSKDADGDLVEYHLLEVPAAYQGELVEGVGVCQRESAKVRTLSRATRLRSHLGMGKYTRGHKVKIAHFHVVHGALEVCHTAGEFIGVCHRTAFQELQCLQFFRS